LVTADDTPAIDSGRGSDSRYFSEFLIIFSWFQELIFVFGGREAGEGGHPLKKTKSQVMDWVMGMETPRGDAMMI